MAARICLTTGARWAEAQLLSLDRLKGNTVIFANTKSKRVRSVPHLEGLATEILQHWQTYGPFTNCLGVLRVMLLYTSIKLREGRPTTRYVEGSRATSS